jgi:hypothetical protein
MQNSTADTSGSDQSAEPDRRSPRRCPYCGAIFTPPARGGKPQRFCSAAHRVAAWAEARIRALALIGGPPPAQTYAKTNKHVQQQQSGPCAAVPATKTCAWCQRELPARDPRARFCDRDCQAALWGALRWAAAEDFEAGRLTIDRLHEVDARFRAEAAALEAERDRRKAERAARPRRRLCRRRHRRAPPPPRSEPAATPTTGADHGE